MSTDLVTETPITSAQLGYLINHLFLPKELPQINDEVYNISSAPLHLLSDITKRMCNELPERTREKTAFSQISRMMSDWLELQSQTEITHDSLLTKIHGLQFGCLPLYVRNQNATIMIDKQAQSTYVSWFQASATSEDVMTSNSDLAAWFPAGSVVVPHDGILRSEAFAKQLTDLTNCSNADSTAEVTKAGRKFKECREVEKPNFVSEWLMAVLCAGGSAHDGVHIHKKIRDDVLWDQALEPFRRSGFYFSIKVVLQLNLTSLLGEKLGKIAYKLLILRALHQVCELWWKRSHGTEDDSTIDLGMQLLAKQAQRLHKLDQLCERSTERTALSDAVYLTKQAVCRTLQTVRQNLEFIREQRTKPCRNIPANIPAFTESQVLSNCKQSLKSAKPKIALMLNILQKGGDCWRQSRQQLRSGPRNTVDCQFPNVTYLSEKVATQEASVGVALLDIENWLRKRSLTSDFLPISHSFYLYQEYLDKASEYYCGDPLGTSRMTLAAVRMIIEMDRYVAAQHPLLLQYRVGVEESLFELLLLKTMDELKYMKELVNYIRERDFNTNRSHGREGHHADSLLTRNPFFKHAFGVVFAGQSAEMRYVRNQIMQEAEVKKLAKLEEVRRAKQQYLAICREADKLTHEIDQRGAHNSKSCGKCRKEKEADKITVDVYELPLPQYHCKENAVIFELRIPDEIAMLRDALYLFQNIVMRRSNVIHRPPVFFLWRSFGDLRKWSLPIDGERMVTISSTVKPVLKTHYVTQKIQDYINQPDSAFISQNGMNIVFSTFSAPINFKAGENLADYYTFALETPYQVLNWTVQGTRHSENEVICRQVECPPELNVSEFIRFGCLRAGHRVQLHNVVECLEARSLSFKQRSVVSLILQAVYQVGPLTMTLTGDSASASIPESHLMLRNGAFAQAFLDSLVRVLNDVKRNWRDNFTLLAVTLLAARIVSLSPQQVSKRAMEFLLRCREVSTEWEGEVERVLSAAADKEEKDVQALRLQLASIAATSILTFGVDANHVSLNTDTIPFWLMSNARLHENLLISGYSTSVLDSNLGDEEKLFYRNLFRQVRTVQLLCERQFHSSVTSQCLKIFIDNHWAYGQHGTISKFYASNSAYDWWHSVDFSHENSLAALQISLDGQFLVNGSPVGKLSSAIQNHQLFIRVFKDTFFDVSPSMKSGETVTKRQCNDCFYAFRLSGDHLLITETSNEASGERKLLLLPHLIFQDDLPELFCAQYSHWIDVKTLVIYFRPKLFNDAQFRADAVYKLHLAIGHLVDASEKNYLLDMNQMVAKKLFDSIFKRLELKQYVHVFSDRVGAKLLIDLPRFGLQFQRDESAKVSCIEFGGMSVAEQQTFDSLIGLEQGIFLTHDDVNQPNVFLVPHAATAYDPDESAFKLDLESLREPAYFAYRVDNRLRQLRPPESDAAVFYLAYLHAATSSALPDSFTGLTGSERAMQILGSAACFSCKPYDKESLKTLEAIARLSPKRSYYPKELKLRQTVKFPRFVAASQALDAYRMMVNHLIELTLRVAYAFPQEQQYRKALEVIPKPNDLHIRAFRRSSWQASLFMSDLEQRYGPTPEPVQVYGDQVSFAHLDDVRRLIDYWNDSSHIIVREIDMNWIQYFADTKLLQMKSGKQFEFPCISEWLKNAPNFAEAFQNEWFQLFQFATSRNIPNQAVSEQKANLIIHLSLYAYKCVSVRKLLPLMLLNSHAELSQLPLPTPAEYAETMVRSEIRRHTRSLQEHRQFERSLHGESVKDFNRRTERAYKDLVGIECASLESRVREIWNNCCYTVEPDVLLAFSEIRPSVCNGLSSLLEGWHNQYLDRLDSYRNSFLEKAIQLIPNNCAFQELPSVNFKFEQTAYVELYKRSCNFRHLPERTVNFGLQKFIKSTFKFIQRMITPKSDNQSAEVHLFELPVGTQDSERGNLPVRVVNCESMLMKALRENLETSWQKFIVRERRVPELVPDEQLKFQLFLQQTALNEKLNSHWSNIMNCLSPHSECDTHIALERAGLWPRIVPSTVLPCICSELNQLGISDNLKSAVLNYATLLVEEMRMARCLSYCRNPLDQSSRARLVEELQNTPHSNWSAADHPAWVIFELENDLVIRPMQVEVAQKMIEPANGENTVMQLNMGEGKTAVIVPIVLLDLADSKKLARLTVLKSLLQTNYNALKYKLGWMLNRRAYEVPISRDLIFESKNIATFQCVLNECLSRCGVYLTVPEYRNSLKLKCLETCSKKENASKLQAEALLGMWDWLQQNARDILDESDEVLHVKFQLVYTLGQPKTVDGTEMRWQLAEATLNLAAAHLSQLKNEFGEEDILFVSSDTAQAGKNRTVFRRFPTMRLLSNRCYQKLCDLICDDILADKSKFKLRLRDDEKQVIRQVVRNHNAITQYQMCEQMEGLTSENKKLIRLLRGLLSHDVLAIVLSKRWRVNYGVNKQASRVRLMAVPFRGKDMPSERTEFGHPDVAIMLTVLSYYYSGLSDDQLDRVYKRLQSQNEWERERKEWITVLNKDATYELGNPEEKRKLYDLLRFYPPVIDFFMNWEIFPREAKSFTQKIVTSAWDLAEKGGTGGMVKYPTTGFSGTNETQLLLPCTISQKDLPALQETNGKMVFNLLKPENNHYQRLNANSGGLEILDKLTDRANGCSVSGGLAEVRVLLDVGGLVIDLDNKQVAQHWLQITPADSVLAALFFDESNDLVVLDRRGMQTRASHSPYITLLDKCVIYLDDAHTRGTDLRFPHGFRGCVTLGKGVTKDRLVQACMRMRMLGNGHSVCFYASQDVHFEITALKAKLSAQNNQGAVDIGDELHEISSLDVLNWAIYNSGELIKDSFFYWSAMAASYWRRASAYASFKACGWSPSKLLEKSYEAERSEIKDMYALNREETQLPNVAQLQFRIQRSELLTGESSSSFESSEHLNQLESQVMSRCLTYVPNVVSFCELTVEEQERELECEVEYEQEERQIERPGAATPSQAHLHEHIHAFTSSGEIHESSEAVLHLHEAFKGSTLEAGASSWTSSLLISRDFKQFAESIEKVSKVDDFLRAPRWVAVSSKTKKCVILSQFEANEVIQIVSKSDVVSLHLFTAIMRKDQRQLFNDSGIIVSKRNTMVIDVKSLESHWADILTQLQVFGGSLYFTSDKERRNWLTLLGLLPDRVCPEDRMLYDLALIDRDGFVPPNCREMMSDKSFSVYCKFSSSPVTFVRQLLKLRSYNMAHKKSDAMLVLGDENESS